MSPPAPAKLELISDSVEQTRDLGARVARCLRGGEVVALTGHLGAGKTQWVKGLAAGLGLDPDDVHSPTFTLINEYGAPAGGVALCHVDVYRLASAAQLTAIGFEEIVAAGEAIVAVEWADRVAELIPAGAIWIDGAMPSDLSATQRRYRITTLLADVLDALG